MCFLAPVHSFVYVQYHKFSCHVEEDALSSCQHRLSLFTQRYIHNDKSWPISSDIRGWYFVYLKRRDVLRNRTGRPVAQHTDTCGHGGESWCWLFMRRHSNTACALHKLNISLCMKWSFSENPLDRHRESSIHLYFST